MPFQDTNKVRGVPVRSPYRVGRSDLDPNNVLVERGIGVPWPSDPAASWVYYACSLGTVLDSGIVVHSHLPQVDGPADTLSSCDLADPKLDLITSSGVNLRCRDQYSDIVQRMGHARYWFRLWGQAMRVGYKVPIPGIKLIGGVKAIPYDRNPQWGYCGIAPGGNYSGVILWHATWSLWYTTASPPRTNDIPAADPAGHIGGTVPPPKEMQAPFSLPDGGAQPSNPGTRRLVAP